MIKKVKNTMPGEYAISDRNGEKIVGMFDEKEFEKTNKKEFRGEKVIERKRHKLYNCMLNGKTSIVLLILGLIKQIFLYKAELFFTF